jgi:hypothetical protein
VAPHPVNTWYPQLTILPVWWVFKDSALFIFSFFKSFALHGGSRLSYLGGREKEHRGARRPAQAKS